MDKTFTMKKDHLEIKITHSDEVIIPVEGKNTKFGTASGTQIQKINLDKVPVLLEFLEKDFDAGKSQIDMIDSQLKEFGEVFSLGKELVKACTERIGKGTKVFKQKMLPLSDHLLKINKVEGLIKQKEFLEKRLKPAEKELADLKKALE